MSNSSPLSESQDSNSRESPPSIISNEYEQWRLLFRGGHGVAYSAVDSESGSLVEVRLLRGMAGEEELLARLKKRLRLIDLLENSGARKIIESSLDPRKPTVILEPQSEFPLNLYLEGVGNSEKVEIARQLTSTLHEAHGLGLCHGALSLSSIRVNNEGLSQIDFTNLDVGQFLGSEAFHAITSIEVDLNAFHNLLATILLPVLTANDSEDPSPISSPQREGLLELIHNDVSTGGLLETPLDSWLELLLPSDSSSMGKTIISTDEILDPKSSETKESVLEQNVDLSNEHSVHIGGDLVFENSAVALPDIQEGEKLGRFQIKEIVGEGGMGKVYRAIDLSDDSEVAVKVLQPTGKNFGRAIRRFHKEARMLGDVQNDYVTRLYDFGFDAGYHYLAMEFIEGTDLKRWLKKHESLTELESLALVGDIARALVDAHSNEIIHRDMKPDNVLLKRVAKETKEDSLDDYQVKLSDFGIARHVHQTSSMELTQTGSLMGTPHYMSPEQCNSSDDVGPTSDVYSLGVILYELLTGSVPFQANDIMKLVSMHCLEEPTSIQKRNSQITDATSKIVHRALSKDPAQRFADASQLLREVERVLCGEPLDFEAHPKIPSGSSDSIVDNTFEWIMESPPEDLWPYVSDTERLNRSIGLPAVNYRTEVDPKLGLRKFGSFKFNGITLAWEEHPFEWIEGKRMGILREFSEGPFKWFLSVVSLDQRIEDGKTILKHRIRIEPRNFIGRILANVEGGFKAKRNLGKVYKRIDRFLTGGLAAKEGRDSHESPAKLSYQQAQRLRTRTELIIENGVEPDLANELASFLKESSPQSLAQIRPLILAEEFQVEGQQLVDCCLHAASVGLLTLGWDILCPTCRAPAIRHDQLSNVKSHSHCEACDADFESNFGDAIELVFQAHPEIRSVDLASYCIGGPEHSPHVVTQLRLEPNERLEIAIELSPGDYLIRGPRIPRNQFVRVQLKGAPSQLDLKLSRLGHSNHIPKLRAGRLLFTLTNDSESMNIVRVERTIPRDDVITASMASAMSVFRELFPDQILDRDNPIVSKHSTLLSTTVRDVENLYRELGDPNAYRLIQNHLDDITECIKGCGGSVSKVIGEGLLAAFPHCEQGVAAAIEIREAVLSNEKYKSLDIGVGVHSGSTLVATQNDRLDYFGPEVRKTIALPQHVAAKIILTESVFTDPEVLKTFQSELTEAPIKTISIPGRSLSRVQCLD